MSHVTLEYIQANHDPNAVFIMTKSTNANTVVYSGHSTGVKTYWVNLEPDTGHPLYEELTEAEEDLLSLQWVNDRQAYFEKMGTDKLITFSEDFRTCWVDVVGEQRLLSKLHGQIYQPNWLSFPSVSEIAVISRHIGPGGYPIQETIRV